MAEGVRNYEELRDFVKATKKADCSSLRGTFKTYLEDKEKYNRMKGNIEKKQAAKSSGSKEKYR